MKKNEAHIALNPKQYEVVTKVQEHNYEVVGIVAGRGGGKTHLLAILIMLLRNELPRAKGGFGGITVKQIKTVSIPVLKDVWKNKFKLREYNAKLGTGDYIMWKEPPPHFTRPYIEPEDWANCITFADGFCIETEGFKLTALENRGKNHDFYLIDEFAFFKEDWMKIVTPTLRANTGKFSSNLHHTLFFFTSPPLTSRGLHVWKYKELAKKNPERFLFVQFKTLDNQMFLPPNFIQQQRAVLTKFEFEVEIEGKEIKKNQFAYYTGLGEHNYIDYDDTYYNPDLPLTLSCDFNANFTCSSNYQRPTLYDVRCVGNTFIRESIDNRTMARSLGVAMARQYAEHRNKKVVLTGDRNGNSKSAGSNKTMFEQVAEELRLHGWEVSIAALTYNPKHRDRSTMINDILSGNQKYKYRLTFDAQAAKSTLVSMENAAVEGDYEKDKSSEKSGDQELATHLSDTVDYFIIYLIKGSRSGGSDDFDVELA